MSVGIGTTLTGGIQDISALLPLLGTEQCENHASSALTKGYLYAAATPMSIFGSLGMARAGFKTLAASFSIHWHNIEGARTLANMGFEPQGVNLSLIMIDEHGRYLVETRLKELLKELHIEKGHISASRSPKCTQWNFRMILLTAILSSLSIVPYIHLNMTGSKLGNNIRWIFPVVRAIGGFLTVTTMQLLIQRRITTLAQIYLAEHHSSSVNNIAHGDADSPPGSDLEKGPGAVGTTTTDSVGVTWILLVLLLLGILASVVGYVGCFSVVQNAVSSTGPLSWLCLEAGMSVIRMILWGYNPELDDAPPLELNLKLDTIPPLPTCNKDNSWIEMKRVLPLTRARQFLNSITSFIGPISHFNNPDISLYYTLTRKRVPGSSSEQPQGVGEHVLYITLFDHKERTTRIYMQDGGTDHFYSTGSDVPDFDIQRGLVDVGIILKAEASPGSCR